jgi:hypothetical protein
MRLKLHALSFAAFTGIAQTSAEAANILDPPAHHVLARAHRHTAYPHVIYQRPQPLPPLKFGWVLMPGNAYAPISPEDYSLPSREYYSRLWEPYPFCCPDPYFAPAIFP